MNSSEKPGGLKFKTPELGDCYTSNDGASFIICGIGPSGQVLIMGKHIKQPEQQLSVSIFDDVHEFNLFLLDDPENPAKGFWMHYVLNNRHAGIVAAQKALTLSGTGNVVMNTSNASRPAQLLTILNHTLQGV